MLCNKFLIICRQPSLEPLKNYIIAEILLSILLQNVLDHPQILSGREQKIEEGSKHRAIKGKGFSLFSFEDAG